MRREYLLTNITYAFIEHSNIMRIRGPWRIGAGLPQLERERKGRLTGVKPGKRGSVQGLSPRF